LAQREEVSISIPSLILIYNNIPPSPPPLLKGEAGHEAAAEAKAKLARSTKAGRVQELIDLYESGDLFIWDAPKKFISLK
jgi:hypothetical protein